jgi:hypothetical protein
MIAEVQTKNGVKEIDLNRRKAIRLKCLDCSGFERQEVTNCTHTECSLFEYRSGRGKQDAKRRDKAIKTYCMSCTLDQPFEITNCTSINCSLHIFRGYTLTNDTSFFQNFISKNVTGELPNDSFFKSDALLPPEKVLPQECMYIDIKIEQ